MVNWDSIYSYNWKSVKIIPKKIVIINLFFLSLRFIEINELWDQVIESPEEMRIIVLSKGISYGLNEMIPKGGQSWPISIDGERAEWKYAQKNEKKNRISDVINKIIPNRIFL